MNTRSSNLALYAFLAVVFLIALHATVSFTLLSRYRSEMKSSYEDMDVRVQLANSMREVVRERSTRLHRIVIIQSERELSEEIARYDDLISRFDAASAKLSRLLTYSEDKEAFHAMLKLAGHGWRMQEEVIKLVRQNDREAAIQVLLNTVLPVQDDVLKQVGVFNELQRIQRRKLEDRLESSYRNALLLEIGAALMTLLAAGTITLLLRRLIAKTEAIADQSALSLKDYAGRLEEQVAIRTQELSATRDLAVQANQAKSLFLANMSHELRTPLNAIIGYCDVLEEEALDSGLARFVTDLNKIQNAGRHLLELINTLLDVAKVEAGRMPVVVENFAMTTFLNSLMDVVHPLAEKNGNQISLESDPAIQELETDRTKLMQILLNLISNACKFTEYGQVMIRIARVGGDEIEFSVEDTGIGMDEGALGRVFEPFTQADSSTTRRFGGTGLGLTLVQHFVTMLGGSLSAHSQPDLGSCFKVWLPNPYRKRGPNTLPTPAKPV